MGTQIEYALVDLDRKNSRATLLLEQEKVIRQWEARKFCLSDAYDQRRTQSFEASMADKGLPGPLYNGSGQLTLWKPLLQLHTMAG
jgi:hypothetical protein